LTDHAGGLPRLADGRLWSSPPLATAKRSTDDKSGAKDEVDTVERGDHSSERIIYTALRDAEGTYRGVLETVVPLTDAMVLPLRGTMAVGYLASPKSPRQGAS
jgi:hypothetical protein